jgi:transcriptional regulator with XRE-family HTH domain
MLNPDVKNAVRTKIYAIRMEHMGDRIRQLREARRMTQTQLGHVCGVTKSAVSQWESGSTANIRLPALLALVEALGTDVPYLAWGSDRAPVKPSGRRKGHTASS